MLTTEYLLGIVIGLIIWWMQYKILKTIKTKDTEHEKRGQARAEESLWVIRLMKANACLTLANCVAIRDGTINGQLTKAREQLEIVTDGMDKFLQKQAVDHYTK